MTERLAPLEQHVRRGEFIQAIREAEGLLMLPDLLPRETGRALRLAGRARGECEGPFAALKLLEMAIPWSLQARDWDNLGATRADLGTFWLMVGDFGNAVQSFREYLLDLPRYEAAKGLLGHVHYNLALAYRRRWEYQEAADHYEAALNWFVEKGYSAQAGTVHQNLAWLQCLMDRPEAAAEEIDIAESFTPVCGPGFRVEQLVCRAFYLRLTRQVFDAMKLVQEVLKPGRPDCTAAHKGNAAWIAGCIALDLRDFDNADYFARLAAEYAIEAKDTSIMGLSSRLKADVARLRPKDNEAAI